MGKSLSYSLTVSSVISFALLALYKFTDWFGQRGTALVKDLFNSVFVLPRGAEGLAFNEPAQYIYFVILAFVTCWVCMEVPKIFSRITYLFGAIFLTLLLSACFAFCGVLFEPFSGVVAIALGGLFGLVLGGTEEGQRQRKLHRFFVGRVSASKFDEIVNAKEPPDLSGKREITVLTCRILNYPELSSQTDPHDLEKIATEFLKTASAHLAASGAYLDSCNAEGIRAFFGMLGKGDTHAVEGCKSALELHKQLVELEKEVQKRWSKKALFGIALSTGPMTVGVYGEGAFEGLSAVGEALDFSRRLCSINLVYGSQVLIGARTFVLTKENIEARPMEMVYAPRMHQISEVYELIGIKGSLNDEEVKARDAFWQGVVSLRKGDYKEATMQLKKARIDGREDAPLQYFLERAEAGMREDAENAGAGTKPTATRHMRMLTAN
jgi:class 3 adenylate cyclase